MATETALAQRLKTVAQRYTQSEIARRTGTWVSNVHHYLNGTRVPADFLAALCEKCGVNAQWLLTGEGPPYVADLAPHADNFAADVQKLSRALDAASKLKLGELFGEKRTRVLAEINEAIEAHRNAQERASAQVDAPLEKLVDRAHQAMDEHDKGNIQGLPRARGLLSSARQLLRLSEKPIRELEVVALEGRIAIRESRFADALAANRRAFLMSFSVLGPRGAVFLDLASKCAFDCMRMGFFSEARLVRQTALSMARAAGNNPDYTAFDDVALCQTEAQLGDIAGRFQQATRALPHVHKTRPVDWLSASAMAVEIGVLSGELEFGAALDFEPRTYQRQRYLFAFAAWTEDVAQLRTLLADKPRGLAAPADYVMRFHDRWKRIASTVYRAAWNRPRALWREVLRWDDLSFTCSQERERATNTIRACQVARLCGELDKARELLLEAQAALAAMPAGMDVFLVERATHHRNALVLGDGPKGSTKARNMRAQAQRWFREHTAKGYACFAGFGV